MNGLHRLRLVASFASMSVTLVYVVVEGILAGSPDLATLLALIGWNLTTLGLYRWPGPKS